MSIIEIEEKEYLKQLPSIHEWEAIYFFTSFCGTCQVAERMLEIIETMNNHIPMSKMNINYSPYLRDKWQIKSVPCLVLLQDHQPVQFIYAMRSVDYLYDILKLKV